MRKERVKARIEVRMILEIWFRKEKEKVRFDQQHELLIGMRIKIIRTTKIIRTMIKTNINIIKNMLRLMNLMKTVGLIMKKMNKNSLRINSQL